MKCISIRLPDNLHRQMKVDCAKQDIPINSFVVEVLSKVVLLGSGSVPAPKNFSKEAKQIVAVKKPDTAVSYKQAKEAVKNIRLNEKTTTCPNCGEEISCQDITYHVKHCEGKGKE